MKSLGVLILAAGGGRRYGMPKALAEKEGKTFLEWIVFKAQTLGIDHYTAVIGAQYQKILQRHALIQGIEWRINDHWRETDMKASLLLGLPSKIEQTLMIWPVDHPAVSIDVLKTLYQSWKTEEQSFTKGWIPVHRGQRGHPILLSPNTIQTFRREASNYPHLRAFLAQQQIKEIEVKDKSIALNINTPRDLETWIQWED